MAAHSRPTSTNVSGYVGVSYVTALDKWRATLMIDYHQVHLGYFDSPYEAHCVRLKAYRAEKARAEMVHDEAIHRCIASFIEANGYSPAMYEIGVITKLSYFRVRRSLVRLAAKGIITLPPGQVRSISILVLPESDPETVGKAPSPILDDGTFALSKPGQTVIRMKKLKAETAIGPAQWESQVLQRQRDTLLRKESHHQ